MGVNFLPPPGTQGFLRRTVLPPIRSLCRRFCDGRGRRYHGDTAQGGEGLGGKGLDGEGEGIGVFIAL